MKTAMKSRIVRSRRQDGAALIVGLILLVIVTVLAISGMNTATTELAIARNDQNYENAFQAAETGLALALSQASFPTLSEIPLERHDIDVNGDDDDANGYAVDTVIRFQTTGPPPDGYSIDSHASYHFVAEARAESQRTLDGDENDRDASAVHSQGFYVIGPSASTL